MSMNSTSKAAKQAPRSGYLSIEAIFCCMIVIPVLSIVLSACSNAPSTASQANSSLTVTLSPVETSATTKTEEPSQTATLTPVAPKTKEDLTSIEIITVGGVKKVSLTRDEFCLFGSVLQQHVKGVGQNEDGYKLTIYDDNLRKEELFLRLSSIIMVQYDPEEISKQTTYPYCGP